MEDILQRLRKELLKNSEEHNRESGQRYFKDEVKIMGVKAALVHSLSKDFYRELKNDPKKRIFYYCEELWKSGILEETGVAANWSYYIHRLYQPEDFQVFESWVQKYVNNWASCDIFCNHTMGTFIEMYPKYLKDLRRWAHSKNLWVRRASAVSLIIPAKKGKFLEEIFGIADILLTDTEDMVQKGYGWMLKAASHRNEKEVFEYVMKHKKIMPRTALRYAIEKMPLALKAKAMER